jgi:glutaredoxin
MLKQRNLKALLISVIILSPAMLIADEIYKWVDKEGRVHYGDRKNKPKHVQAETIKVEINTYISPEVSQSIIHSERLIMYSTAWCPACKKAKRYFKANNIPFIEYDIEKNKSAYRRYKKLNARGVPVILYKKKRLNGFSPKSFERIYQS